MDAFHSRTCFVEHSVVLLMVAEWDSQMSLCRCTGDGAESEDGRHYMMRPGAVSVVFGVRAFVKWTRAYFPQTLFGPGRGTSYSLFQD
jgi:hypothetical protein